MKRLRDIIEQRMRTPEESMRMLNYIDNRAMNRTSSRPNPYNSPIYTGQIKPLNFAPEKQNQAVEKLDTLLYRQKSKKEKHFHTTTEEVPLKDVHTMQHSVEVDHLRRHLKNPDMESKIDHPVEMIHHDNKYYIVDGNHRVMKKRFLNPKGSITAIVHRKIEKK